MAHLRFPISILYCAFQSYFVIHRLYVWWLGYTDSCSKGHNRRGFSIWCNHSSVREMAMSSRSKNLHSCLLHWPRFPCTIQCLHLNCYRLTILALLPALSDTFLISFNECWPVFYTMGLARTLKKLRTPKGDYLKGDYWIKQWFSSIASLFKMGTSLKGKNLLPEGANSFLYEQFLIVWKITFITLSDLLWMLIFLLRTCIMGATPMSTYMYQYFFKLHLDGAWESHLTGDKNISILHLSCRTSDKQLSLILQTHALVLWKRNAIKNIRELYVIWLLWVILPKALVL